MENKANNVGAQGNVYINEQHNYFAAERKALPSNIPTTISFVGREDYLQELHNEHQIDKRAFVFWGMGGAGKTALTFKFAEEIGDKYATQIFVDMQGLSKKPLSAIDAMYEIVKQFEPDLPANLSAEQIKTSYVQYVKKQPTLIVLDNAKNEAQIAALLSAKPCLLVSSRNEINLTGGITRRLGVMSSEDAEELLLANAPAEKFAGKAGELAELAGYLPMAMKPLAKLLAKRFGDIDSLLTDYQRKRVELLKLTDADHDNLSVRASFELSYENLSEVLKRQWCSLAVFPSDFEAVGAATVLEIEPETARNTLERLYEYSLLEENIKNKADNIRFRLHDLARDYTRVKLSTEDRTNGERRHAKHYASIFASAEGRGYAEGLELLDLEWSNITMGQQWAANNIEKADEAANICLAYSGNSPNFVKLRLHPDENVRWLEVGLRAARKLSHRQGEGNILNNLGTSYKNLGYYRKAIEYHEQSLKVTYEIGDQQLKGNILGNLGITYDLLAEYRKAIGYYKQSLEIAVQTGNRQGEANNLNNLGITYGNLGENIKALEYHEQSLEITRKNGDRRGESNNLKNLGIAYNRLGENRKAIGYHEQSLKISCEIGDRQGESNNLNNLGVTYGELGEYQKAIGCYERSLEIANESGHRQGEANNLNNLGLAYYHLGENRKAVKYYEQSLKIKHNLRDRQGEGNTITNLGLAYYHLGENDKACSWWKDALIIFKEIESPYTNALQQLLEKLCVQK